MDHNELTPEGIWNFAQNKPTLVAKDFEELGVPREKSYSILLARGVFKWLAARRDIIKLKNIWRDELSILYIQAQNQKGTPEHREMVGRIKAMEMCRKQVRAICHSERWRAPDFDRGAKKFLEKNS